MLIDRATLDGIREGRITHVYRRWATARAKVGGRQRTVVGELRITSVDAVPEGTLGDADASGGGYASLEALRKALSKRTGTVWRIGVCWSGEDPRSALRTDTSAAGLAASKAALDGMDRRSRSGPFAWAYLRSIAAHEGVRAQELADAFGVGKQVFKPRVRRLKELGLTESLSPGYRLSPRGLALLEANPE